MAALKGSSENSNAKWETYNWRKILDILKTLKRFAHISITTMIETLFRILITTFLLEGFATFIKI